jgi:hypothetical protein
LFERQNETRRINPDIDLVVFEISLKRLGDTLDLLRKAKELLTSRNLGVVVHVLDFEEVL